MKTKTRILAMLLTVLMVVGILPLSLFALDATDGGTASSSSQSAYEERGLDEIKTEFAKHGMTLGRYQSFDNLSNEILDTVYTDAKQAFLGTDYDNSKKPAVLLHQSSYNDYDDGSIGSFMIANQNPAFSIVDDGKNNKALYLGAAAEAGAQDYINFNEEESTGGRTRDVFVSADIKLEGDKVFVPHAVFTFIYRGGGPHSINTLLVNEDGELYFGSYSKEAVVGRLTKDSYTRVALATDRVNNKYYVYVNDVLVNPGGTEYFSKEDVNTYNTEENKNYTVGNIPLDCVRLFVTTDNVKDNGKSGVYFDNLVWGSRYAVRDRDTADKNFLVSNFAGATAGENVYAATQKGDSKKPGTVLETPYYGTSVNASAFGGAIGGQAYSNSLKYVDENDDGTVDAIKFGVDQTEVTSLGLTDYSNAQTFM